MEDFDSRNEKILKATIDGVEYVAPPQSRIEDLLLQLKQAIEEGGSGGSVIDDGSVSTEKTWSSSKIDSTKLNASNPIYTGALSNGRKNNTTVGTKSIAIGNNAEASGSYSASIGSGNKVTGQHSLAFGNGCTNTGLHSFVCGNASKCENTSMWGGYCFAFGNHVKANGDHSVAFGEESETTLNASHSLALGYKAIAKERSSIALGYGVIAASFAQFVFGYYNIEDSTHDYIEIVGNGDSDSARSNARTLDESGNEWLAGNITADGDIKSANVYVAKGIAIAPEYSDSATYDVDDYVTYKGLLYKCNTAISTAEAWDSTHWTQKYLIDVILGR